MAIAEYAERNRRSLERLRAVAARLSDADLRRPLGEHWTAAVMFAHLAFWDTRTLRLLDATERAGTLVAPGIDLTVNDILLPCWRALPPREAVRLSLEAAEMVDARLESYPRALIEVVASAEARWVVRASHRDGHLDELEAALRA